MPGMRLILFWAMARVSAGDTRGEPRNVTGGEDEIEKFRSKSDREMRTLMRWGIDGMMWI